MYVRKTERTDIDTVMQIYARAQKYMVDTGNPTQWKKGYPTREMIESDVEKGISFVCVSEDGIEGVFVYFMGDDPTYSVIEDGEWQNDLPYGVMHRMASAGRRKGIASFCLDFCFEQCHNLRGDTHKDNKTMQRVFEKNGFIRCGIIYVADGSPRIAYQRTK